MARFEEIKTEVLKEGKNETEEGIDLLTVTRKELRKHKVRELKKLVKKQNIPCIFPCEKIDLIQAIWLYRCQVLGEDISVEQMSGHLRGSIARQKELAKISGTNTLIQELLALPFKQGNCPSQILPHLFLGGADSSRGNVLEEYNISAVINLCAGTTETREVNGVTEWRIAAEDSTDYDISPYFKESFEFIERFINEEKNVLVHCLAGVSRSCTIVLSYLIQKYPDLILNDADYLVFRRRPFTNPNSAFLEQLETFYKEIHGEN